MSETYSIRKDSVGELDEYFADDAHVHVERMDTRSFWIGITPKGKETIHLRTGVQGNKWYFRIEDESNVISEVVERPSCYRKHSGERPDQPPTANESTESPMEAQIVGVAKDGTIHEDLSALEKNDIAFDPTRATLDLTKAEKRRTTALLMAVQAYNNIIIKDAEMYNAISRETDRSGSPKISEATMDAMVEAAIQFDAFIAGKFEDYLTFGERPDQPPAANESTESPTKEKN